MAFDSHVQKNSSPESKQRITDAGGDSSSASPFSDTVHQAYGKPEKAQAVSEKKVAEAAVPDVFAGKTEAQAVKEMSDQTRQSLGLKNDASGEEVYKQMGINGYKQLNEIKNAHAQAEFLKQIGLTKDTVSPEAMTNKMIERDRKATGQTRGSLDDLEKAVDKKFYKDVKSGHVPIDYD